MPASARFAAVELTRYWTKDAFLIGLSRDHKIAPPGVGQLLVSQLRSLYLHAAAEAPGGAPVRH